MRLTPMRSVTATSRIAGRVWLAALLCWALASAQRQVQSGQPRTVQLSASAFEVIEYGSGETLLMLPGPGGLKTFERLTPLLVRNGYRCVIVGGLRDARGNPVRGLSLREYALRIAELI